jgi:hypothetical protein
MHVLQGQAGADQGLLSLYLFGLSISRSGSYKHPHASTTDENRIVNHMAGLGSFRTRLQAAPTTDEKLNRSNTDKPCLHISGHRAAPNYAILKAKAEMMEMIDRRIPLYKVRMIVHGFSREWSHPRER